MESRAAGIEQRLDLQGTRKRRAGETGSTAWCWRSVFAFQPVRNGKRERSKGGVFSWRTSFVFRRFFNRRASGVKVGKEGWERLTCPKVSNFRTSEIQADAKVLQSHQRSSLSIRKSEKSPCLAVSFAGRFRFYLRFYLLPGLLIYPMCCLLSNHPLLRF